ncbi:MAG: hypothetical protein KDB45_11520 [Mycobacterium sp.]|nr:hypothetical protein [Mycobacterium sp.]
MATQIRPLLMTGAAFASAAAIVAATPAIMPNVTAPAPLALSAAQAEVQLATFSDLLSITPEDWNYYLFQGWGQAISPNQNPDVDWFAQFLDPFSRCDFNCQVNGPSGVAYLALDALLNGNGYGINYVNGELEDPSKPYQPDPDKPDYNPYVIPPWGVSSVNYFFEAGAGSGVQYLLTQPFGDPASPLYNPTIAGLIYQVFQGSFNVTLATISVLDTISKLAATNLPFLGPYIYGGIQAALGPYTSDEFFGDWGYFQGLSGVLRYTLDVVLSGGNPLPPYPPEPTASASVLPSAAVTAPEAASAVASTPAAESAAPDVQDAAPVETPAEPAETPVELVETPADPVDQVDTPVVPAAEPVDTPAVAAVDVAPVEAPAVEAANVEAPAALDEVDTSVPEADEAASAPVEAPAKSPRRSARGAVERAAKSIASALGGSKAAQSSGDRATSTDTGSGDKSSDDSAD